ncbi:MAG TPA: GDP-mannose 4,6-dehydratase [Thermoleophilaceae bacterium]|nr:GDP-mannose 4,6-dehydratase [Thermoleophilaceae bacterium]
MTEALVTGGSGFAGRYLVGLLDDGVAAPSRSELDLGDAAAVRAHVAELQPTTIFHLAAFSSPSTSLDHPDQGLLTNLAMTLNLLEAVRHEATAATVVLVGSGQVYGDAPRLPITEETAVEPGNPYAVGKAASDMLGHQYAETFGLRVVRLRPFNHAGPGQRDEYVVSSLARQVAEAEAAGLAEVTLRTGNPESRRDFTDVRDVVRAYALAAKLDGGAFNVCSGRSASVAELVELVAKDARIPVHHEVDPARLRAHDARDLCGSHERLTAATGWKPEIPLDRMVRDTLDWWREQLEAAARPSALEGRP